MIAPITGFIIDINDDGSIWLSAPDYSKDGHTWAIEHSISIQQLRDAAVIFGRDAVSGLESRLSSIINRQEELAAHADARFKLANDAKKRAAELKVEILGGLLR